MAARPTDPPIRPAPESLTLQPAVTDDITVESGGVIRDAIVHVPPLAAGVELPLIIALHGSSVTPAELEAITGFDNLADTEGFIVVYPEGIGDSWNSGECCTPASSGAVDDVAFLRELIATMTATYRVDVTRIYLTGHSNGALMAQRAACALSNEVAAMVSVSGALDNTVRCAPAVAVPMLEIHGTDDPNVSYGAGYHSTEIWRDLDGCSGSASRLASDSVVTQSWDECADDATVELVTLLGAGHAWPQGSFDASAAVWSFLQTKTRLTV